MPQKSLEKVVGIFLNLSVALNHIMQIASAKLSNMALSCATQKHAKVVHFANTVQQSQRVDSDDSKVAAVLSNFVLQCGEKNATMS